MKTLDEIKLISSAITACASDIGLEEDDQNKIIKELCSLIVSGADVEKDRPEWFEGCHLESGFYKPPVALSYLTKWALQKAITKVKSLEESSTFLGKKHPIWNEEHLNALKLLSEDMKNGVSPLSIYVYMSLPTDIKDLMPLTVNVWLKSKYALKNN